MQDERELQQIEQYLNGTLATAEASAFAEKLKKDPDFAQKVSEYQNLLTGIEEFGQDEFLGKVRSWETALAATEKNTETKTLPLKQYFARAAVVLLVLLPLGYWMFLQNTPSSTNDELFALYFEPYHDVITPRSPEAGELLSQGMEYYNSGNYEEAITYLEKYLAGDTDKPAVDFYLGMSYLATHQTAKAIQSFKKVIAHGDSVFVEIAEWNLALAYLKEKDEVNLKRQLQSIISMPNHPYHARAIELDKQIE